MLESIIDLCQWKSWTDSTIGPWTTTTYYYHTSPNSLLYTWRYGNNGEIEVGLPGITKKDLELKKDAGVLSISVSGKVVFTFPVAPEVVAIRGKINEGLLTITFEKKKDECPVSLE